MKYNAPFGFQDPDAGYVNGVPGQTKGSAVPAEAVEFPQREIVAAIEAAGLEPANTDLAQLAQAIGIIAEGKVPSITPATQTKMGIGYVASLDEAKSGTTDPSRSGNPAFVTPEGVKAVIDASSGFVVAEPYFFRHPTLKQNFAPAQGGLISGIYQGFDITSYPIWAYLQTSAGQLLCITKAQWQAMSTATWATLADETKVGWNGIGGVPFFVQDLVNGTLRLPDYRGMYAEAAGYDSLGVGDVHGDGIRPMTGNCGRVRTDIGLPSGPFSRTSTDVNGFNGSSNGTTQAMDFSVSRVHPVANKVQGRAFGALACVYLGQPAS